MNPAILWMRRKKKPKEFRAEQKKKRKMRSDQCQYLVDPVGRNDRICQAKSTNQLKLLWHEATQKYQEITRDREM